MRAVADQLVAWSESTYVDPSDIAKYYVMAGAAAPALDWLEKAVKERAFVLVHLFGDPLCDSLRDHPRYRNLRRRLGLAE
jgi:hypothetical protein